MGKCFSRPQAADSARRQAASVHIADGPPVCGVSKQAVFEDVSFGPLQPDTHAATQHGLPFNTQYRTAQLEQSNDYRNNHDRHEANSGRPRSNSLETFCSAKSFLSETNCDRGKGGVHDVDSTVPDLNELSFTSLSSNTTLAAGTVPYLDDVPSIETPSRNSTASGNLGSPPTASLWMPSTQALGIDLPQPLLSQCSGLLQQAHWNYIGGRIQEAVRGIEVAAAIVCRSAVWLAERQTRLQKEQYKVSQSPLQVAPENLTACVSAATRPGCSDMDILGASTLLPATLDQVLQQTLLPLTEVIDRGGVVESCLVALESTTGWASGAPTKKGFKVRYKHTSGSVHSVRVEAIYDWPLDCLFAVAREFDVVGSYNTFALDHSVLAEPSIFESIVYAGTYMPFPMKALELILSVKWANLLQTEGVILISLEDAGDRLAAVPGCAPLPPKSKTRRRGHILPGSSGIMRPLPPGPEGGARTKCTILAHLDTGLNFIPGFVINFVLRILAPFLFGATKRLLVESFANPDGQLLRRIAAKPELYGMVRKAVADMAQPAHSATPQLHLRRTLSCRSSGLLDDATS